MKSLKLFLVAIVLFGLCRAAEAQQYFPGKRQALEFSIGYAPLPTLIDNYQKKVGHNEFADLSDKFSAGFNVSYIYDMNEKWTFETLLDISTSHYEIRNYETNVNRYDDQTSATVNAVFRRKWYTSDAVRLYSSFGVGVNPWCRFDGSVVPIPLPYLTPLGITFGKKTVYGVSELTVGAGATSWLIGIGINL